MDGKMCCHAQRVSVASAKHSARASPKGSQGILEHSLMARKVEEQGWG